jgi:hypothetical protein
MAAVFVLLSGVVLAIPVILLVIGLGDPGLRGMFVGLSLFVAASAVGVWVFYKPKGFVVDKDSFVIEFPMRRITVERSAIVRARALSRAELRETLGFALRVGVGGLFGVFGLLWTSKLGWVRIYATSSAGWLLVESRSQKPLIVSPKDAAAVARALG